MPKTAVILQIIPGIDTGGAERTVIDVAEAIAMAGGRALVASEGGRLEKELADAGGELIRMSVAAKNPLTILANARKLGTLIAERGVTLVHARSRAPAWSALLAARRAGVPFVTTYHGIYNQKGRLKSWYNGVMARGAIVIANSQYTARIVQERHGTPGDRLRVIYRGADLRRFDPAAVSAERVAALRTAWDVPLGVRLVVMAARLTRWKGQHVALGAAARVLTRPDLQDVVLILAGDDQGRTAYSDELRQRIAAMGLSERIRLTGHCADMPAAYLAASLALMPSIEPEAFGRVSAEAQAMGCPVIVSDLGALPETIVSPDRAKNAGDATGWVSPAGDEEALAERIVAALSMPREARDAMSAAARRHVAVNFSKAALQRETLRVYDSLLDTELALTFQGFSSQHEDFLQSSSRIRL
ncbi:MAG TPA: glycosyltransferase family 4 protein [Hyphomicrobiales bacterium]|jgi:glycosyltransferase involved in cell wall biosynthesis